MKLGRKIFYGLGNFCFDWNNKRNGIWNQGYMVELKLNNGDIYFNLYPYEQCNVMIALFWALFFG